MIKIGGFLDYIMSKIKFFYCFFNNLYLNLLKMSKNIKHIFSIILSLLITNNNYCFDTKKEIIKDDENDEENNKEDLKKKKIEEQKKLKEEKKKEILKKKQEEKEIKEVIKSLKDNNDNKKDKEYKDRIKKEIKQNEEEIKKENLKKSKKVKKSGFVTDLEKKIEEKNKELLGKNNIQEEEKLRNQYKELQNEYIKKEIERIIEMPEQKNLSKSFDEKLIEINTKYHKQKYLKVIKPIESIEFLGLDFFSILLYLANLKKEGYIYELLLNLVNVNWGIIFSTGLEGGMSFIKKNNITTNSPFINFTFSFRYNKTGNLKFLIGLSKVNIDNKGNYQIPMWWGITPINVNIDIYKLKNIPLNLFLNIEVLFKRIITADLTNCRDMINIFPINNVCPYLRDKGEINIFDVFLGIKIALGFKYKF